MSSPGTPYNSWREDWDIPEKYFPLDAVGGEQQLELNPPRPNLCHHHCKKQVTSSAGEGAGGIPLLLREGKGGDHKNVHQKHLHYIQK